MVVSKDSKRKRKESPQQPVIESSPEMPKRTKVQAQRKFAQGQNAPTSSYTTTIAASSSSTTGGGPSASSESREPPTEILPNKRPKTEDFLTFLCFRGTSALPAHLDFLNQGKSEESDVKTINKKKNKGITKLKKKQSAKKGRKLKSIKVKTERCNEEPVASTSAAAAAARLAENKTSDAVDAVTSASSIDNSAQNNLLAVDHNGKLPKPSNFELNNSISNANKASTADLKKLQSNRRNRGGNNEKIVDEKSPNNLDKRRSNRNHPKYSRCIKTNDDNNFAFENTIELKSKLKNEEIPRGGKSQLLQGKECAFLTQTANDSTDYADKTAEPQNMDPREVQMANKQSAKQSIKRLRQKESTIFIPSPEPAGRMTRQRAFFEPVKITSDSFDERMEKSAANNMERPVDNAWKHKDINKGCSGNAKSGMRSSVRDLKNSTLLQTKTEFKSNTLNVFDFSSDDEQPLSKSIKLKGEFEESKKKITDKCKEKKATYTKLPESSPQETLKRTGEEDKVLPHQFELTAVKNKGLGKVTNKKKNIAELKTSNELIAKAEGIMVDANRLSEELANKSIPTARQQRKMLKTKPQGITASSSGSPYLQAKDGQSASPSVPAIRSQRPSRKTKEAAAIYMGIIGHKLQQNDDEDDDLSLSSFPDLPNVKEMEKMEFELKKNTASSSVSSTVVKSPVKTLYTAESEKQAFVGRRGRPPKQTRLPTSLPAKREIEGMLVKKGALTKTINTQVQNESIKEIDQNEALKMDSEDEDFLLNEEVNETKRKLEKSFSDSDDEPLAVKVNIKSSDKDMENVSRKSDCDQLYNVATVLPINNKEIVPSSYIKNKAVPEESVSVAFQNAVNSEDIVCGKGIENGPTISNLKVLNVPTTYVSSLSTNQSPNAIINKMEHKLISPNLKSYLPPSSPHYSSSQHQSRHSTLPSVKSPTQPLPATIMGHIAAPPPPPQSPLKYQTTPTSYPPPIEAYPSPKINPNFLTPKFDRSTLPRANNFPSSSPLKFDLSVKTSNITNSTQSPKSLSQTLPGGGQGNQTLLPTPSTMAVMAGPTGTHNSCSDPLKDEIGSILAANLMPSKEESGKIFGIASVSLAQSSGPDNTKCTLGKCGSIHKPVLGPVVPTEGYIGDQLSSKERRKAKVNMTHEQIQKWLIECSSNPDEIQDDIDDDYDDNLRPNLFPATPPPTRDDKESTSFSSSSKATRDLGKSESAWSGKGPSLKAIPVVAGSASIKEENTKNPNDYVALQVTQASTSNEALQSSSAIIKGISNVPKMNSNNFDTKSTKEKAFEKKHDKKNKDEKLYKDATKDKDKEVRQIKSERDKEHAVLVTKCKTTAASKLTSAPAHSVSGQAIPSPSSASKTNRKKILTTTTATSVLREEKQSLQLATTEHAANITQKRTPVYNQKIAQTNIELKETTTTSHKKKSPFSYKFEAFSVDNEKSIYSFDKDDDEVCVNANKTISKPIFRRQSRRDSQQKDEIAPTTLTPTPIRSSPVKKRNVGIEKPPKDVANASQNSSVSLTLSPSENCKLVKVSLEAEQQTASVTSKSKVGKFKSKLSTSSKTIAETGADSDSDGHTFYIPLQGAGAGGSGEGGIQGVAVKLGREGPEGPNQKVIMHATLVTKAQMGQNSKPLPDSMNASEIVKNLLISSGPPTAETIKNACASTTTTSVPVASTSAAAGSASNSLKSVPVGTVQPRFKGTIDPLAIVTSQPSNTIGPVGSGLVRVNSNSSLFSSSAKSKHCAVGITTHGGGGSKKLKDDRPIKMSNNTAFPRHDDPTQMVEAPIFRPSEKEFSDPIDFIERITPIAARFGICKIIPPSVFKPECRISDEMRFTAYNQYVHKMLYRWGPSAKELSAIKKYLATQSIVMNHPPWIGGMEVDLPRLYHTVQEHGGLKEVIEKKKWARVAEEMCIPKLAQDRVTKLDDIYCKYLLPYDTLSPCERQKLFDEVEADWAKREARARRNADRFVNTESVSNEEDDVSSNDEEESEEEVDGVSMECIVKGRSMPLSQFYRIARNTMTLWFKNTEPTVNEVEAEFWRHVAVRDSHVCVHSGSIDSSGWGYGFPSPGPKGKGSNYARHPWNLKVLTNNSGSVLRSLGPVMGVTVPTLHVGMLFSACCWYRDPHGLSWIEYLHTGASKLWYGIPDDQSSNFRAALTSLIPTHCQNKTIWLPCDTVMVPPHMLTDRGVSLCRIEQKPGEFIVVFPRAYTSSLATGYVVSESVYFATNSWLDLAKDDFKDIHDSCEPAMFSLEQLLFALGSDQRVSTDTLQQMLPMLNEVYEKETAAREQLKAAGVTSTEKVLNEKGSKSKKYPIKSMENECDLCRANLYISMVRTDEGNVYCLQHALKNLNNGNIQAKQCKLIFSYNTEDVENLITTLNDKIQKRIAGTSNKRNK